MCIVRLVSILFLICLLLKHEISAYFVQHFPHRKTWFDAQAFCNNKGGRLATNKDNVVGLNCNQLRSSFDSPYGSTYWTGKYKTISPWISKIGCYEIFGKPFVAHAHSVSKCFEVCRDQHIKIKLLAHIGNNCVCISENITSLANGVDNHKCIRSLDSDNNYWAYKVTTIPALNGPGNCAVVDCRYKAEVYTDICTTKHTPFCDNSSRLNWNRSQEKCKSHTIPGDLWDICRTMTNKHLDVWLPMQRVAFWTEVTCDGIDTEKAVTECESFRCYHRTGVSSYQANTTCNEETNGFFCAFSLSNNMTDRTKPMNGSAILCLETYSYKSIKARSTSERTLHVENITGTTSIIEKQNDNGNFTDISDHYTTSNIGLIIGGVLGALAMFGVVILAVILTLRRRKASTKNQNVEQIEISDEDQQRKTLSNNIRVNQLYEDEGAHESRLVPVRTKETECANEQEGKKSNDVYAVVMKNNMTTTLQVGINSVVASEDAAESEYDRLNITPKVLTDNMEYNLYDSSIADRCESDPTYNTATNIRHSRKNTEDVYD